MQCQVESYTPNFSSFGIKRIPDNGVIELTCDRGHRTFILMQTAKYEILSDLAVTAICDGYYREEVASYASALECLFEHYVNVVCRSHSINPDDIEAAWKPLRNSSERQFGAFAMLYLSETGKAFSTLDTKYINFRNKVIHQRFIPGHKETLDYGQAVGNCAAPLIALLHSPRYEKAQQAFFSDSLREKAKQAIKVGARHSTQWMATPFGGKNISAGFDLNAALAERAMQPDIDSTVAESYAFARLLALLSPSKS